MVRRDLTMKQNILIAITGVLIFAFSFGAKAADKKVTVTVLELKSMKPVENATVSMVMNRVSSIEQIRQSGKTDANGRCFLTVETGKELAWSFTAKKDGYFQCFNNDLTSPKVSSKTFISELDKDIVLYLTVDVEHLKKYYYSITPHYQIDTLVNQLKNDSYKPSSTFILPDLKWEDIPKLLALGNDQKKITKFTVNPVSSVIQEDCYLGIYALWLIESIRISYGNPLIEPFKRFPSQRPVLFIKTQGSDFLSLFSNTPEQMEMAYIAYDQWWEKVKNMNPEEACKINPLAEGLVHW